MRKRTRAAGLLFVLACLASLQAQAPPPPDIDAYVAGVMRAWCPVSP